MWNRCLTFIGVNNVNVEKKERVNVQETTSNLDEILYMRRDRLNAREFAGKQMKELWGWNVKVSYYSEGSDKQDGGLYYTGEDDSGTDLPKLAGNL